MEQDKIKKEEKSSAFSGITGLFKSAPNLEYENYKKK